MPITARRTGLKSFRIARPAQFTMLLCLTESAIVMAASLARPMRASDTVAIAAPALRREPTRALFRFHRDDQSPNKVTRVHINARHTAADPISQNVFGNFIEHLGGVIYEGLWAQALLNPNLEQVEKEDKAPPAWELLSPATWVEGGYLSPRCVRLPGVSAPETGTARLVQTVSLPVHRIHAYTLTLYARAPKEPGRIAILLQKEKTPQTLCTITQEIAGSRWRKFTLPFVVPPDALAQGEAARFVVANQGVGAIEVDQITLFPNDHLAGMDPEVIQKGKAWHIPITRYPGGNFVSGYRWEDGVGPRESRPTRRNPAWGGAEPNHYGTDEFMRFCKLLGTQPQITVNAGDGTPENAADWVRYCNSPAESNPFGAMRAKNGHRTPYNIRVWEIGNELYGDWQIGHTNAEENAVRFVRFRDAMLQADPTLRLIATGKGDEFTAEGWQRCQRWNEALLRAALAHNGRAPDWISIHPLLPLPGYLPGLPYADEYESAMALPTMLGDTLLPDLAALIERIAGPNARTRIAPTEWGIIIGGGRWERGPNHDTQAGAIFNALTLNAFLRNSDSVTLANMTAFLHGGGIKRYPGGAVVDPQYWTQALYAQARPRRPVETTMTGPGVDVPARGALPAVPDTPDVDVFSALTADGKLVVFAVNRQRTEARPLALTLEGFAAARVSATLLTAPDPQARNSVAQPNAVSPRPFPAPPLSKAQANPWQVTIPAHSLLVLMLER